MVGGDRVECLRQTHALYVICCLAATLATKRAIMARPKHPPNHSSQVYSKKRKSTGEAQKEDEEEDEEDDEEDDEEEDEEEDDGANKHKRRKN